MEKFTQQVTAFTADLVAKTLVPELVSFLNERKDTTPLTADELLKALSLSTEAVEAPKPKAPRKKKEKKEDDQPETAAAPPEVPTSVKLCQSVNLRTKKTCGETKQTLAVDGSDFCKECSKKEKKKKSKDEKTGLTGDSTATATPVAETMAFKVFPLPDYVSMSVMSGINFLVYQMENGRNVVVGYFEQNGSFRRLNDVEKGMAAERSLIVDESEDLNALMTRLRVKTLPPLQTQTPQQATQTQPTQAPQTQPTQQQAPQTQPIQTQATQTQQPPKQVPQQQFQQVPQQQFQPQQFQQQQYQPQQQFQPQQYQPQQFQQYQAQPNLQSVPDFSGQF
jgi:hypothetical protein